MRYRNPVLAEADHEADLRADRREFWQLLLFVGALVVGVGFALDRLAWWAAPRLPFAWEQEIARTLHLDTLPVNVVAGASRAMQPQHLKVEAALQQRLNRIAHAAALPPDIVVTAHFVDSPTVNAVATLGGHITVFSGLLNRLEYEEELDAVLAHELGHVQHRHMVRQLSRGLTAAAGLSLLGIRSAALNRWLLGDLQQLQQLAYSREAEREADSTALVVAQQMHGHMAGVQRLFERFEALQNERGGQVNEWEAFTKSHPLPAERAQAARAAGTDAARPLTPLRAPFKAAT